MKNPFSLILTRSLSRLLARKGSGAHIASLRLMKVSQAKQKHTALLGVLIFAAGCASATAKLVSASDVSSCKPLGDVTIQVDSAAEPTPDDRATALQRAAADKGATDVVSDGDSPSGSMHGRIFDCGYDRDGKPPSRSEQRSGF